MENNIFDVFDTPFQKECQELISRISNTFEGYGFTEKYKSCQRKECTYEEFEDYIFEQINPLSEKERHDFNMMHKMLSTKNCWYGDYDIGERIHNVLISRIWNKSE